MNRAHCHCSPAYGALMHALPRDASALKRMTEMQMFNQAAPWVDRVPHATEHQLDTWTVKAVNPNATNLGDLGDLAELEGIKKKLKKVAKKIAAPVKKVVKAQVKIVKKAAKSKIIKKIAKPLAYAVGAATGTLAIVAKADKMRTTVRKAQAKLKAQKEAVKAQFAIAEEKLGIEPAQVAPEQAQIVEPVEQVAPETMVYNEPAPQYQAPQQSFAPIQQAAPSPQRQAPVQVQRQQVAPEPMVYDEPEPMQASFAPVQQSFAPIQQAAPSPQRQAPLQQSFAPSPFYPQSNPVTRLPTADEETEDQPRVVGISATGIMDNIKANPLPWMAGAAVAAYLVTNRKTSHRK